MTGTVAADGVEANEATNGFVRVCSVNDLPTVGAGHASTTGRFDDEALFYLQSRGIPADEARRLVVRGFFADVINQIGIPSVQERLMARVESELEGSVR